MEERFHCEAFPIWTLGPVPKLIKGQELLAILRPIIVAVPVDKYKDGGETNIDAGGHVTDEALLVDDAFVTKRRLGGGISKSWVRVSWRLEHDIWVRRVEGECGGW